MSCGFSVSVVSPGGKDRLNGISRHVFGQLRLIWHMLVGHYVSFSLRAYAGDCFLFTWYDRFHVEHLSAVYLHLHGLSVQHSNIISEEAPNTFITPLLQRQITVMHQNILNSPTCKDCCISTIPLQNSVQHRTACLIQQPQQRRTEGTKSLNVESNARQPVSHSTSSPSPLSACSFSSGWFHLCS